jgi:hypothetical protein
MPALPKNGPTRKGPVRGLEILDEGRMKDTFLLAMAVPLSEQFGEIFLSF